ncbi:MFS transporter [Microvirga terrestris]|uniref:MFS transporter n=1 Tax=Microvirga terrestris TaxID=2791024 RepID=A0ABS0HPB1_9HYPH|nr:MFS transporter [Microvirga terrestris]MBF9195319.1 MFS transporter [Microvirga terrestris]
MSPSGSMPWRIVSALSITHLISYGTLFYAFALLIEPMERDLGWSKTALTAAFSLALISSAFFAVPVGRLIDQGYGRAVMTGGSVLAALLLALWAYTDSYPVFLLIWLGLGAATSALFYEAGFAVLALNLGLLARRGITIITLVAGFASTVFIPLLHVLIDRYGWRDTILVMAALNVGICAVLHAFCIPAAPERPKHTGEPRVVSPSASNPRRVLAKPAFWFFVITSVLQGMISTGIPVHLIPIFLERGFSIDAAVAAYTMIGPAQVAARFLTGFGERAMSLKGIGVATMALSALGFLLLPFIPAGSWLILAFASLYGASNGMLTIVRALLPPELFGRENYGAIQGMIAMPVRITMAIAPFAFGALWAWWGSYDAVIVLCLGMAVCSLVAFMLNLALANEP